MIGPGGGVKHSLRIARSVTREKAYLVDIQRVACGIGGSEAILISVIGEHQLIVLHMDLGLTSVHLAPAHISTCPIFHILLFALQRLATIMTLLLRCNNSSISLKPVKPYSSPLFPLVNSLTVIALLQAIWQTSQFLGKLQVLRIEGFVAELLVWGGSGAYFEVGVRYGRVHC